MHIPLPAYFPQQACLPVHIPHLPQGALLPLPDPAPSGCHQAQSINCKHFFPFPARTTVRAAAYGGISFMEEWRLPFFSTNHRFVHASSFRRLWRHFILKKPFRTRCGKAFHVQPVSLTGAVFRYKPGYRRPHTERVRSRSRKRRMPGIRQVPADPQQLPSGQPESLR